MISSNFGYGEQSSIASAYAQMYAPKSILHESCCKSGCGKRKPVRKPVKEASCCESGSKKTGSKLGRGKMMDFKKRDAKPSCGKSAPKSKKDVGCVKCLTSGFCISDGDKTLCTNDANESYFSKGGITGETRIYESAVSALKDIKKVSGRRKPNSKYRIRKCQCVGESFEFVQSGDAVNENQSVNEGFFDGITNTLGGAVNGLGNVVGGAAKGLTDVASGAVKGVGNVAGNIPLVGGAIKSGTDIVGDAVSGAGNVANNLATGAASIPGNMIQGVGNAVQGGVDSLANYMKKDDKKPQQQQQPQQKQPQQQTDLEKELDANAQSAPGVTIDNTATTAQQPKPQQPQQQQSAQSQQPQQQQDGYTAGMNGDDEADIAAGGALSQPTAPATNQNAPTAGGMASPATTNGIGGSTTAAGTAGGMASPTTTSGIGGSTAQQSQQSNFNAETQAEIRKNVENSPLMKQQTADINADKAKLEKMKSNSDTNMAKNTEPLANNIANKEAKHEQDVNKWVKANEKGFPPSADFVEKFKQQKDNGTLPPQNGAPQQNVGTADNSANKAEIQKQIDAYQKQIDALRKQL